MEALWFGIPDEIDISTEKLKSIVVSIMYN